MADQRELSSVDKEKIKNEYKVAKAKISSGEQYSKKIYRTITKIRRKINRIRKKENTLNAKISEIEIETTEIKEKLRKLLLNIKENKLEVDGSYQALNKILNMNKFSYFLNFDSMHDFEQNMLFMEYILNSKISDIVVYEKEMNQLNELKKDHDKNLEKLKVAVKEAKENNKQMSRQIGKRKILLRHLNKKKAIYLSKISKLRNKTEKLSLSGKIQALNKIFGTNFFDQKGFLLAPSTGTVVEKFGVQVDKRFKSKTKSNGIFMSTKPGAGVRNVHPGKVHFIGKMRGLGRVIVVDHLSLIHI